ncbi:ABC transporter ATP-binding protein [Halogeometricum borinquense]|uniref:ABC transporter ATP-binding protein n=1 Tax=Halogeometricum borinquense TaxID=60847 RepID=A0A6C0ULS9_9EURY|nr:ABC transporter ATP-binding protein [Halogeometricum borinquense]QIB75543.1 ABC transporter ATP-binding protein [Halogeometricum borinquense]
MTNAITTTDLAKDYGNIRAVDAINLAIERGTVFGFLGPNGSGKSTTIGMLLGLIHPTGGTAALAGHDPQEDPVSVRSNVGVLPEGFTPYPSLTGREHLTYIAELRGEEIDPEAALSEVGLKDAQDRAATAYSKGMTQRLGLAMALIGRPPILVLDEPFTGLDPDGAQLVRDIVMRERERGTTILFSSHILGQVGMLCDEIGILSQGRLVTEGSLTELQSQGDLLTHTQLEIATHPDSAVEVLTDAESVQEVTKKDKTVVVEHDSNTSHLALVRQLEANGITAVNATVQAPTVEDIYREFT